MGGGGGINIGIPRRRGRRRGARNGALWRFVHEWLLPRVSRSFRATYGTSCHSSRTNGVPSFRSKRERKRERAALCMYSGWSRAAFLNYCLGRVLVFCRREREKIARYLEGNGGIDVSRAFSFPSIMRSSEECSLSWEISRICVARRVSRDSAWIMTTPRFVISALNGKYPVV